MENNKLNSQDSRASSHLQIIRILYEDNHLVAVYKPAGVLVQGDEGGERCLMDEVKDYLKEKYKKSGNVFLGLLHRLDRPVGGIVLFAKTSKGASRLSEQFRNHTVEKTYQAVVAGRPAKKKDTLVHWLKKDEKANKVSVNDARPLPTSPLPRGDGDNSFSPPQRREREERSIWQRAELSYEVIKSSDKYSFIKIKLGTGRSHQIRAQFSFIGCPIVGDVKYGGEKWDDPRSIALAATSLTFKLATLDEEKIISVDPPVEWKKYL